MDTIFEAYIKAKEILVQAWTGPGASRMLRLPDLMTI